MHTGRVGGALQDQAMQSPRGVCVVIPNRDDAGFLAPAIDSPLAQDHLYVQMVVADDSSTDNSRAIIAGYVDRVDPILLPGKGGRIAALQAATAVVRQDFVEARDSDNLRLPHAPRAMPRGKGGMPC